MGAGSSGGWRVCCISGWSVRERLRQARAKAGHHIKRCSAEASPRLQRGQHACGESEERTS